MEDFVTDKTIYIYIFLPIITTLVLYVDVVSIDVLVIKLKGIFACACTQACTLYIHTHTCSICTTHTYLHVDYTLILHHMHQRFQPSPQRRSEVSCGAPI